MAIVAPLACSLLLSLPQGAAENPRLTSVLSKAEQKSLNTKARKWFASQMTLAKEANPGKRTRIRRKMNRYKAVFLKDWLSKQKKKEPLAHMGDLLAIFQNVFSYKSKSGSGELKRISPRNKEEQAYSLVVPRGYRPNLGHPAIMLVPGRDEARGAWEDGKAFFDHTWKGTQFVGQAICVLPRLSGDMELDPIPDLRQTQDEALEKERLKAILSPFGEVQRAYNLDRERLILDCGKGACGFAVRLASYFPSRFAGLVLRHPADLGKLRVQSLAGLPVLLIKSKETKAAAEKLEADLNAVEPGHVTVLDAKGEYPFPELAAEIGKWASKVKRDLFRQKVVLAPNHDVYKNGYWVAITLAEPLENVADADRPYLVAETDPKTNRITVTTKSIMSFQLLLNDALVDLDREFTVVVNGKAITQKRVRNFNEMTDLMLAHFDPGYIFTTHLPVTVPKSETPGGGHGGEGSK